MRVVVGEGCALDDVRAAAALWAPLTDRWTLELGEVPPPGAERFGEVYIAQGDLSSFGDGRIGNTRSHAVDNVQHYARTTLADCSNFRTLAHELGHVLGFAHSDDDRDLMKGGGGGFDVPAELHDAMARARD